MRYAVTGPKDVTPAQVRRSIAKVVAGMFDATEITTRSQYGVDSEFAQLAYELWHEYPGGPHLRVVIPGPPGEHNPDVVRWADEVVRLPPAKSRVDAYGKGNTCMLDHADKLLAFPNCPERPRGSGTWWTVRMARRRGIPVTIIPI